VLCFAACKNLPKKVKMRFISVLLTMLTMCSISAAQELSASLNDINLDSIALKRDRLLSALELKMKWLLKHPSENKHFNLNAALDLLEAR
jgi:hypothetical protein